VAYATLFSKLLNKNHMEFVLSKYHLATDELSELGFVNKRIIFSTRTATSIMVDEKIYQNLVNSRLSEISKHAKPS
jgi:hypothetical protein